MRYEVTVGDVLHQIEITQATGTTNPPQKTATRWLCRLNGRESLVDVVWTGLDAASLLLGGKSITVRREFKAERQHIFVGGVAYEVSVRDPRSLRSRKRAAHDDDGPQRLIASMPGKVVRILAREGEQISAGQGVIVVEAMKMQNEIRSPKAGRLSKLVAREGSNVTAGEVLALVE